MFWNNKPLAVLVISGAAMVWLACEPFAFFAANNGCVDDTNCPFYEVCGAAGICVPILTTCVDDTDCGSTEKCINEFCVEQGGESCTINEDCPQGQGCLNLGADAALICVDLTGSDCVVDDECTDPFVCYVGNCVDPAVFVEPECDEHSECPNTFCDFTTGACVPASPELGEVYVEDDFWETAAVLTPADLEELKAYNTIVGNVYIGRAYFESDGTDGDLELPNIDFGDIRNIYGELRIEYQNTPPTTVTGAALKTVTGGINIEDNNAITSVSFLSLETATAVDAGAINITGNRLLETVDMQFVTQAYDVGINGNGEGDGATVVGPANVFLGSLVTTGGFDISIGDQDVGTMNFESLQTIDGAGGFSWERAYNGPMFANLTSVTGRLDIIGGTYGMDISLPSLTTAGGIRIRGIGGPTSVSAPLLTDISDVLNVFNLDEMTSFDFSALTSAGTLDFSSNDMLPACKVDELAAQLGLPPADVTNSGNLDDPNACL